MVKNILVLFVLAWVSFSYAAKDAVVQDSMADAESYRIEKPAHEQSAKRSVAGGKIKKNRKAEVKADAPAAEEPKDSDSDVRYWQYSE